MTRRAWIATGGSLGLALILGIALVVVIATDDDSSAAGAPATPTFQLGGQLPSDVQNCLSQKRIEPPQPGRPPDSSVGPDELRQAMQDCGAAAPSGSIPFGSRAPGSG